MPTELLTPALVARGVAEDRYLRLTQLARNWMLMSFGLFLLVVILSVAWIVRSFRAAVVPYIVAVDDLGQVAAVGPARPTEQPPDLLIRSQLALFLRNARTIVPDAQAQKALLFDGYAFAQKEAARTLDAYYRAHSPFEGSSDNRTITVQVNSVLPISAVTWQVQWTEYERRTGRDLDPKHYQALLTIRISPPESTDALTVNPLGLYVVNLSWAELT